MTWGPDVVPAGLSLGRVGLEDLCCSSQRQQPQVWWLHFPLALHMQLVQKLGSGSRWQEAYPGCHSICHSSE